MLGPIQERDDQTAGPDRGHTERRPSATVVICAYTAERLETLLAAARAVRLQLLPGDELVIVIDHNEQLLEQVVAMLDAAAVADHGSNAVRVIANGNGRGLSGARNAGVTAALGTLVAFLDDDAVPEPGWLADLTGAFADADVIGAGGVAAPAWEREPPAWLPAEFLWVVGCSYRGLPQTATEIRNPIGANMAFRRSVIRDAGGFTDGIGRVGRVPLGCEETEFSIRAARITGGRIMHAPAATVDHLVTAERLTFRYFLHRCWAEGISKAYVAGLTGGDAALASERRYTTRTLPLGVAKGVASGLRGDASGFGRAGAIITGLGVTACGYLRGSLSTRRPLWISRPPAEKPPASTFTPLWSGELELTEPSLPQLLAGAEGAPLQRARLLVRAHGTPLGFVELEAPDGRLETEHAADLAHSRFAEAAERVRSERAALDGAGHRDSGDETSAALVSIVLCTHNRADGTQRTLESLLELRHPRVELIVVDNAPSDESTRELTERWAQRDPRVRYVREERKGLSCARNRGLAAAQGEYIAFTDDDVRVDPLWVDGLLRGFARDPEVACVTGLVASAALEHGAEQYFDGRVWWSSSCDPRLFRSQRGEDDSPLHPYTAGIFGTGANFAARTGVLRQLGGFDECLGAGSPTQGGEDLDMFVRLVSAGHALSYEPAALVWHEHRVDDESLRRQMYGYGLGLTAYLTKYLVEPRSRAVLMRRIPGGVRHALKLLRRSRAAASESSLEQTGMTSAELRGMAAGPLAYLRARRAADPEHLRAVAP